MPITVKLDPARTIIHPYEYQSPIVYSNSKKLFAFHGTDDNSREGAIVYVIIVDSETTQIVKRINTLAKEIATLSWSPDDTIILAHDGLWMTHVFNAQTGEEICKPLEGVISQEEMSWHPTKNLILYIRCGILTVWDVANAVEEEVIVPLHLPSSSATWSPTGDIIVSTKSSEVKTSDNGTVYREWSGSSVILYYAVE